MRRLTAIVCLWLGICTGIATAQPVIVIDECSTTTPSPSFGNTGNASVEDTIALTADEPIEDVHVVVGITHVFVGDLLVDIMSPEFTVVRLHDASGGSADDLNVTYVDSAPPNAEPYNCGCAMQPSGPGALGDYAGETSIGNWILAVEDNFPTSGGGTLDSWCLRILNQPTVPFIRGDVDGDGVFNGLVDGVAALNYQFVPGSSAPPCLDAADTDDSGSFNGIIDGALCLNFQFIPGSPAPAAPYPACGPDPTAEIPDLGCGVTCP